MHTSYITKALLSISLILGTNALPATTSTAACAADNALNAAIEKTISIQNGEPPATTNIQNIESASGYSQSADSSEFNTAKNSLISVINQAISSRASNQAEAPAGNGAIAGLATLATKQEAALSLAESLTGDPSHDSSVLSTLQTDFTNGIALNTENAAAANAGC